VLRRAVSPNRISYGYTGWRRGSRERLMASRELSITRDRRSTHFRISVYVVGRTNAHWHDQPIADIVRVGIFQGKQWLPNLDDLLKY